MMTSGSGVVDASLAIAVACSANIASVGAKSDSERKYTYPT